MDMDNSFQDFEWTKGKQKNRPVVKYIMKTVFLMKGNNVWLKRKYNQDNSDCKTKEDRPALEMVARRVEG